MHSHLKSISFCLATYPLSAFSLYLHSISRCMFLIPEHLAFSSLLLIFLFPLNPFSIIDSILCSIFLFLSFPSLIYSVLCAPLFCLIGSTGADVDSLLLILWFKVACLQHYSKAIPHSYLSFTDFTLKQLTSP